MINYHQVILDIEKLVHGEVSVDTRVLKNHSKDASLFTVRPHMVIYPKDKLDIQAVVRYISRLKQENPKEYKGLNLVARAAGTDMSGGPLGNSIVIDTTKHMNKILDFDSSSMSVVCEPGLYFHKLENVIDRKGLMYPSYPASKDLCCVGGIANNNSSGEKTLLYGSTKDWIKEMEFVLHDGTIWNFKEVTFNEGEELLMHKDTPVIVKELYTQVLELIQENLTEIEKNKPKVTKNSSGYNLWDVVDFEKQTVNLCKLLCGAQGTFGIMTRVKFSLTKRQKYSQMLTVMMPDLKGLVKLVGVILQFKPEAIETFDDHTFKIAMKFLPSIVWKLKGSIFQLGISFIPEAWMALTGGIPKLILMAEFTGSTQAEADRKAKDALEHIQSFPYKSRVTKNQIDLQKYWLFRRESFNLLRSKLKGFRTAPFIEDVVVPLQAMPEFVKEMQKVLDKSKYIYTIAGHAGNGNFHIIPLMKLKDEKEVELIKKTNQEVFSLVQKYGGSISAEHNDGLVRTPYLHFMFTDHMLELFNKVKKIFDPQNIFNPGKKVGGSVAENYAKIELTK